MTATLEARLLEPVGRKPGGGGPARRAVFRWAWRLFRREWREHMMVLALLTVRVAATTAGAAVATSSVKTPETTPAGSWPAKNRPPSPDNLLSNDPRSRDD